MSFVEALKAEQEAYRQWEEEWEREAAAKAAEVDPIVLLYQTRQTLNAIANHMRRSGTYRYLIYDRLGFGASAYAILLNDGMFVSNWICDVHHPRFVDWWGMTKRFVVSALTRRYRRSMMLGKIYARRLREHLELAAATALTWFMLKGDHAYEEW